MRMKTEFNIINLRETIMVYPFSFSFFLEVIGGLPPVEVVDS